MHFSLTIPGLDSFSPQQLFLALILIPLRNRKEEIPIPAKNIPLRKMVLTMNRLFRQKINKETLELSHMLDQMGLMDIYKTFHPTEAKYTLLLSAYGTFSRIDHDKPQNKS